MYFLTEQKVDDNIALCHRNIHVDKKKASNNIIIIYVPHPTYIIIILFLLSFCTLGYFCDIMLCYHLLFYDEKVHFMLQLGRKNIKQNIRENIV